MTGSVRSFFVYFFTLTILAVAGCSEDALQAPDSSPPPTERSLTPAADVDSWARIFIDGTQLQDATGFSISLTPLRSAYGGSWDNRQVELDPYHKPAQVQPCGATSCDRNAGWQDGFRDDAPALGDGIIWNGVYSVDLHLPNGTTCSASPFAHNTWDQKPDNGSFLDLATDDQVIDFHLNADTTCSTTNIHFSGKSGWVPASGSPLSVSITDLPGCIGPGVDFMAQASAFGGFSLDGYKYAWTFDASGSNVEDFGSATFSSITSKTHQYSQTGTYLVRVLAHDGDPKDGTKGSNYALSSARSISVAEDCAEAVNNAFPQSMSTNEITFTAATLKNTGSATWSSASNYHLDLYNDSVWLPISVDLTDSVASEEDHIFYFNLQAPDLDGTFACFYRMNHTGFFGESNGRYIDVTVGSGGGFGVATASSTSTLGTSTAGPQSPDWDYDQNRPEEFPLRLDRESLASSGAGELVYTYSISRDLDFERVIRVRYDHDVLEPLAPTGLKAGMEVENAVPGRGELWVRLTGRLERGRGKILRLPFRLRAGAVLPDELGSLTFYGPRR